jgi:hypothetical protein
LSLTLSQFYMRLARCKSQFVFAQCFAWTSAKPGWGAGFCAGSEGF